MKQFMKMSLLALISVFVVCNGAEAAGKERISAICAECHKNEVDTIRGLIKAGSQGDDSFVVQTGKDVWNVRYDKKTKLNKLESVKQLGNEEAVKVRIRQTGDTVHAEEISYKPNYDFISADMVMELDELAALLKKDPKKANYALFDVRGVADYQEGHLPGAISFPFYRFNHFKERLPKDKKTLIVTYCNSYG